MPKSRCQYPPCAQLAFDYHRALDGCHHRFLWSGRLYWPGRAACGPVAVGDIEPQCPFAGNVVERRAVALLCNLICVLPGEAGIIPLNAVTPIIGAPVIIYVILSQRKPQQFN